MKTSQTALEDRIKDFPKTPGVYLMKDATGEILYIGKASSLAKRLQSYFKTRLLSPKITVLMSKVKDIDVIETPSEVDALLLEAALVKRYNPRYNTRLKDDKSFPLLKVTRERFPRLQVTRDRRDTKAIYLGPYTDAKLLREAVGLLRAIFPIRKCQKMPKHPCLYYHLGQCLAPCVNQNVKKKYDRVVREIIDFMRGGKASFVQYLARRMEDSSRKRKYEEAQFFKEQIGAISRLGARRFCRLRPLQGITLSATAELKHSLRLGRLPERIVCFDVSNISGREATASKVSFYRELPDKNDYRRYKIHTVVGIDDYAMIEEALRRMLRGLKEGRERFTPGLIVIDGGRGHLNSAYRILKEEGYDTIPLIAIAKRFEEIHTLNSKGPLVFAEASPALHLLKKIRDEAHRFAIKYHHLLRGKGLSESFLDSIPGIGPRRKQILLRNFSSIDELKKAPLRLLVSLPGMSKSSAKRILDYVKGPRVKPASPVGR
ncbi:MAG: excinuclease ABC subunit UvrC [Candidatus Omnitrophica bacterium]|nr:excinuclease ABC subunit UvrC [Candidatus Omnitrophota bacterium]